MADGMGDVWRHAVDANVRYYEAWGRIAEDYIRDLGSALKGFSPQVRLPAVTLPVVTATDASVAPRSTSAAGTAPPAAAQSAPGVALVLEGNPGSVVQGALLVENHLPHPVSAAVDVHTESEVEVTVAPSTVDLAPGESAVVRVSATIPAGPGEPTEIRGQVLAPELVGTAVPLLIRSRPSLPAAP
jgi:hypothetical protein